MNHIHLDPVGGIAGDMLLSALVDLGACAESCAEKLSAALGRTVPLRFEDVREGPLTGKRLKADALYDQPLARTLPEIEAIISKAPFSPECKEKILGLYRRIYEAESRVHGVKVEEAHLHELAAVDTFVDLAGAVLAMEELNISSWSCGPIPTGTGTIQTMHGLLPIPAPATAELLKGMMVFTGPEPAEATTPTGAVLASYFAKSVPQAPPMVLERIGIGFGRRKGVNVPGCLRVLLGSRPEAESVYEVKATMDDITGQMAAHLMGKLFEAGALDVAIHTVVMKKNRPGIVVETLCPVDKLDALAAAFFRESPTIGLRYQAVARITLERRIIEVETSLGKVPVKCSYHMGMLVQSTPEFDVVKQLAEKSGIPLKKALAKVQGEIQEKVRSSE
jgi:hypothetical protein